MCEVFHQHQIPQTATAAFLFREYFYDCLSEGLGFVRITKDLFELIQF